LDGTEKECVYMQTTITAKLKLTTTPAQFAALRQTQLAFRGALNQASEYAFAHGKTSNSQRLHRDLYDAVRTTYGMPSQMACSVFRHVGATYKALWTKAKKNAEARRLGYTKKRFRGLDKAPRYVSPTLTYVYGRDYSLRCEQEVSLLTLAGRLHVPYRGYNKHVALMQQGASIGGAKLWYDRSRKRFYLLVSLTIETPDPTPAGQRQVIGIDVGQRYLATVATLDNGAQFYSGKAVRAKADHYARLQKRLQQKGTRSATRRRIRLGQRERRLKLNSNHTISKRILETHPHAFIGLEELTGIRDRTKRRTHRRTQNKLLPVSSKARKANRHASKWAFAELQSLLAYKATLAGSVCIKVDADYTSQACPRCGHTSKANRPLAGLLFCCEVCHYTLHADLVGARNISLRTLVIRQDWMATGQLSSAPDGTDREAKAVRLSRYAELRWSPVPSFLPLGGSI
jgi:IS605 OrfB family transposase